MAEISDRKSLKAWLDTQPREVSGIIAARAALRIWPPLTWVGSDPGEAAGRRSAILLPTFCATALPWAAARCSAQGKQRVRNAASAASAAATNAAAAADAAAASYAAHAAADAAAAACYAAHAAASYATHAAADADAAWEAVDADVRFLEGRIGEGDDREAGQPAILDACAALADEPLWPGNMPEDLARDWAELRAHLRSVDEGWEVWTDWYQDRLAGHRPVNKDLELARVLIPTEEWQKGPAHLNGRIKDLIAEHESAAPPPAQPPEVSRPPGFGDGPHFYEPASAGVADLAIRFQGALADERVEAELSRFNRLLRHRLLDITTGRETPLFLGNGNQLDLIDLQRVSVAPGSVESRWIVRITLVAALWGMAATYSELKKELPMIQADIAAAVDAALSAFNAGLPEDPPLSEARTELHWRDESEILDELLDKERQARLSAFGGDEPVH